jgi:hypothetical protein
MDRTGGLPDYPDLCRGQFRGTPRLSQVRALMLRLRPHDLHNLPRRIRRGRSWGIHRVQSGHGKICVWTQSDHEVGVSMYKASLKEPDSTLPPRCPRCCADGLPVGPAQHPSAMGIRLADGNSMRRRGGRGGEGAAGHRSWSPALAAEDRLQGGEGLRRQGREAGGEVREGLWVDLRR